MFGLGIFRAGRALTRVAAATGGRPGSAATAPAITGDDAPPPPPEPYLDPSIEGLGFAGARTVRRAASEGLTRRERTGRARRRMADIRAMQAQGHHGTAYLYRHTTQQPEAGEH
jgi:hypothetical protein